MARWRRQLIGKLIREDDDGRNQGLTWMVLTTTSDPWADHVMVLDSWMSLLPL
jgi:hypothetical protein